MLQVIVHQLMTFLKCSSWYLLVGCQIAFSLLHLFSKLQGYSERWYSSFMPFLHNFCFLRLLLILKSSPACLTLGISYVALLDWIQQNVWLIFFFKSQKCLQQTISINQYNNFLFKTLCNAPIPNAEVIANVPEIGALRSEKSDNFQDHSLQRGTI